MRWPAKLRMLFRAALRRRQVEAELDAEMLDHLQQEIESNIRSGMSPDEARFAALRLVGPVSVYKEECRDARGIGLVENTARDLRYGLRVLLKNRSFFATAAITLALGIGTATTLFSVVESQLWRPLPFPEPDRLVVIGERNVKQKWQETSVSVPDFADWRQRTRAFERLAAMQWSARRNFVGRSLTERPKVANISTGFFATLRMMPQAGHSFESESEIPGHQAEAILTNPLAHRAFGSAQAAIGKTVRLDGEPYLVIGVLPHNFRLDVLPTPDVFVPLAVSRAQPRDFRDLVVIGRMRTGVSLKRAQADMEAVAQKISAEHPDTNANTGVLVSNLRDTFNPATRTLLLVSFAFSVFVLLIACANVAGLQLMRSVARRREFAIRNALGASRPALLRQAVSESAWIAVVGTVIGILFAIWSIHILRLLPMQDLLTRDSELTLNIWSIVFAAGSAIASTFVFGLAPGLSITKGSLEMALRDSGRTASGGPGMQFRIEFLAASEVALAFLSLFGTGLFAASSRNMQHIPLGFRPHDVLTVQIPLSGATYSDQTQIRTFYQRVMNQVSAIPGIQEFALASSLPLTGAGDINFTRADKPHPEPGQEPYSLARIVTPDYFHLLGIPIVQGRGFTDGESAASPRAAIINENFRRHFFSNESPVGKQLLILDRNKFTLAARKVEIIGVAANARDVGLDEVPFDDLYFPFAQNPIRQMYVLAKTTTPSSAGPLMKLKIQHLDADQFVANPKPLDCYVTEALESPHFNLWLIAIFASLALLLTAVALYGTLSFVLAQRSREIGIRLALGAQRTGVLSLVLRYILRLTIGGSVCGAAVALTLGILLRRALYMIPHEHEGILYGVGIRDPLSFACAFAIVLLFAGLAGLLPGLRATRIDPAGVLRED